MDGDEDFKPAPAASAAATSHFFSFSPLATSFLFYLILVLGTLYFGGYRIPL